MTVLVDVLSSIFQSASVSVTSSEMSHGRQEAPTPSAMEQAHYDLIKTLFEVREEAKGQDWDGYGARQVDDATVAKALDVVDRLPKIFPRPEISAHPNGEIAFEWYVGPRQILTVSVNKSGRLLYAALYGQSRLYGREFLIDGIPGQIERALRRLYRKP